MKNRIMPAVAVLIILGCAGEQEIGTTETAETVRESAEETPEPAQSDWWALAGWDADGDGRVGDEEFDQRFEEGFTEWDVDDDGALGPAETADAFRAFFDRNRDQIVDRGEWASGVARWDFESVNWGEWGSWDADGDGEVSESEWRDGWIREIRPAWDGDGDGAVRREDLRERFRTLLDDDGDGVINIDEWS